MAQYPATSWLSKPTDRAQLYTRGIAASRDTTEFREFRFGCQYAICDCSEHAAEEFNSQRGILPAEGPQARTIEAQRRTPFACSNLKERIATIEQGRPAEDTARTNRLDTRRVIPGDDIHTNAPTNDQIKMR